MSRRSRARVTRFRSFTRYAPPATLALPVWSSRWVLLLAFLLSPSTAHALERWFRP